MEKRISYQEFQQVKSIAKAMTPLLNKKSKIQTQIDGLDDEFKRKAEEELAKLKEDIKAKLEKKRASLEKEKQDNAEEIAWFESGIVNKLGIHVTSAVKRIVEPTGKTDPKTGKAITIAKYVATDNVSYDEQAKQYVIVLPDEEETTVPPTVEDNPGSDFDADAEREEAEEPVAVEEEILPF